MIKMFFFYKKKFAFIYDEIIFFYDLENEKIRIIFLDGMQDML
jgi:hypothetical protein